MSLRGPRNALEEGGPHMSTDERPPAGDAGGASVPEASARPAGVDDRETDRRPLPGPAEVRNLLRDGSPIVCLASRRVFEQEADYLRVLSGADPRPVPRISVKIVQDAAAPDAPAEEREPAKASGKKGEA